MSGIPGRFLLSAILVLFSLTASAASLDELFAQPEVDQIKISPTGDYLAVRMFDGKVHMLAFIDRKSSELVGGLRLGDNDEVGTYHWANKERVVASVYQLSGVVEGPKFYGELHAINFDGEKSERIFGYRSGTSSTGSIIKQKDTDRAWGEVIDPFPGNRKQILISSTSWDAGPNKRAAAVMLDVYSGMEKGSVHSAKYSNADFLADADGDLRLVASLDENLERYVEALPAELEDWIEFPSEKLGSYFDPIAVAEDKKAAFVLDNIQGDKVGLYRMALDGSDYKRIYSHDAVDVTSANKSSDERGVYALRVDPDYPAYVALRSSEEEASIFRSLLATFPGHTVTITSHSDDGRFWVIRTGSDVDPGTFWLYDKKEPSIKQLFRSMPKLDPAEYSKVEAITYESFDGQSVSGYFTPAKDVGESPAPLVVLVHGGPRVRDYWTFNAEVQALATNGYSVLQVNYRGSIGYGEAFLRAGNRQWGDKVQRDIIAGTRWAIETGRAAAGNVCIMGASFGAYSAVQSSILEPDLYQCAVANAGIYDLELLYTKGDVEDLFWGDAYLEEVVGRDPQQLREYSPVYNVADFQTPLLLAHGKRDQRAPVIHANRLRKALDDHGKPYLWHAESREAHGFYDQGNQVEYFTKVLDFLGRHLSK